MQLLYQTHSPYARKALVFAYESNLAEQLEVLHHETSPTRRNEGVYSHNPLGKVPVLVLKDTTTIFDSRIICEYLNSLNEKPNLIPSDALKRAEAFRLDAIADGMSLSGIGVRWEAERRPEEKRYQPLLDGYTTKILASYDFLEKNMEFDTMNIGHISVATSLSWLEFRNLPDFRKGHPNLTAWFNDFCKRESMLSTPLSGATHD